MTTCGRNGDAIFPLHWVKKTREEKRSERDMCVAKKEKKEKECRRRP